MSLRFKLFIPTLVLLITVSSLMHFFWLPNYLDSEVEQQFEYERTYIKLLSNTLIPDLLTNDIEKIRSTLDKALENHNYWHAIKLYKNGQKRIYPTSNIKFPNDVTLEILQWPIQSNNKKIANMTVWVDIKSSNTRTIENVRYLEQLILSLLFGVSLIAILFQDRWIRKPLKQLVSVTKEIIDGHYDTDLNYHSKDEIGDLANSFNNMRKQINLRENKLKHHSHIQDTIKHMQDAFILNINDEHVFLDLLEQILEITESEHGLLSEVLYDKKEKPYIRTFCASSMFTNNNGNDVHITRGEGIEFHSQDSLPGKVLATGQPYINNAPSMDTPNTKAIGMKNFFGIPISSGNKLIGVLCVANRKGGYTSTFYKDLQALLVTLSGLIIAYHDEKKLHASETRYRLVIDNAADGMITINSRGIMQGCNNAVVKMFGHSLKEMSGQNVSMLMPEPYHSQHDQYLGNYLTTGVKNIIGINREVKGLHKDGTIFPLELAVSEVELGGERMFVGITHDITKRVHEEQIRLRYSKALEKFHKITSRSELSFDEKVNALLKLGQKIFDLPLAILNRIEDNRCIIEYIDGPDGSPEPGTEFPLEETYCFHTLKANKPTGFDHVSESEINSHSCYKKLGFEAYIGAPLYVGDKLHGTISFSSPDIHKEPFASIDYSLILLFTQWVGTEMARVNAEIELEQLSRTDGLTGIANRRYFDEVLSQELNRAIRHHSRLTLIMCDIDFFKKYNDTYGHQAGDVCLKKVTKAIQSSFARAGELVARYGGEEFAVIIPEINTETAINMAEKMRSNVIELNLPHETSDIAQYVSISVGLATFVPDQDTTMTVMIEIADNELYKAKENGRNCVRYFH